MSQTARVKTVINDLAALKQAIEKMGWSYSEQSNAVNLNVKSGSGDFSAVCLSDGKYELSAGREGYGFNEDFDKLSQTYAQIKIYKEISGRSGHGIVSLSEAVVQADGSIVIEGEIDETLLVG